MSTRQVGTQSIDTRAKSGRAWVTRLGASALAAVVFVAAFLFIPTFPELTRASSTGSLTVGGQPEAPDSSNDAKRLRPADVTTTTQAPAPPPAPPVSVLARTVRPGPPPSPPAIPAGGTCSSVIAAVEARGLFPAPGFSVICPGDARGHAGMTCFNIASLCPGRAEIVIQYVAAYVVANEFENSRILSGAPARCHEIDCGHVAYGF